MTESSIYRKYPELYDLIYGGDDAQVLAFVRWYLEDIGMSQIDPILEVGAGTGGIVLPLTELGYNVRGIEPFPGMIREALKKAKNSELEVNIVQGSFDTLVDIEKYKCILSMNGPMHYLQSAAEYIDAFQKVGAALMPGGFVLIDLINFFSLIKNYQYPEPMEFQLGDQRLLAMVTHSIDLNKEVWIHKTLLLFEEEEGWRRVDDTQYMSMVTLNQLIQYAGAAGLEFDQFYSSYEDRPDNRVYGGRLIASFRKPL